MKIKILQDMTLDGNPLKAGDNADTSKAIAEALVKQKLAEVVSDK